MEKLENKLLGLEDVAEEEEEDEEAVVDSGRCCDLRALPLAANGEMAARLDRWRKSEGRDVGSTGAVYSESQALSALRTACTRAGLTRGAAVVVRWRQQHRCSGGGSCERLSTKD